MGEEARRPKFLIMNADEMEPGTFKDRLLLEGDPNLIVESMILGAYAIQADVAYIFLRWAYRLAAQRVTKAVAQAYEKGYLGKNILGSPFNLDLYLHTSAGRYMCGEEDGLLDALQGKRAIPRTKPPHSVTCGLWGKPTAVNNVETLANVPHIINNGPEWFRSLSHTNDGGTNLINNFADALLTEYQYTTKSGTQSVKPLEMVRLAGDYAGGTGAPGVVYIYNGTDASTLNLGNQNYAGNPLWVRFDSVNIVPAFGNISNSDSVAVGGLVVRNDVRGGVDASIEKARIEAAALNVSALENATITAWTLSAAEASGGSAFGTGTVIAGNGTAATNLVLSHADAWVKNSDITTDVGDISVLAQNTSVIDATLLSSTSSGDTAVGVVLAFNSVGWESQNMLLNALDALIGRPLDDFDYLVTDTLSKLDPGDRVKAGNDSVYRYIGEKITGTIDLAQQIYNDTTKWLEVIDPYGNEDPARVSATVLDSKLTAAGDVTVTALNEAMINATMSNAASSAASALINATGKSFGGILASNKVSSAAEAWIDYTAVIDGNVDVDAVGNVTIEAQDNAGIYANTKLVTSSVTSNDGGLGLVGNTLDTELNLLYPPDHVSDEVTADIEFGDRVQLANTYGANDFSTGEGVVDITNGKYVLVGEGYADPIFTSDSGTRLLRNGDVVELSLDYDASRGEGGALYRFIGEGSRGLRVNLGIEDYTDTTLWKRIGGNAGSVYEYLGGNATGFDLSVQDYSDNTLLWRKVTGAAGDIYIYMGEDVDDLNLTTADYSDTGLWKADPTDNLIPGGINFTTSDSISIGGLVVLNDVRSEVESYIENADVESDGAVTVCALESAVIRAETDNTSSSSGGSSITGEGDSIAGNGVVATNLVLSSASATIDASNITTSTAGLNGRGDIVVDADNISQIDAWTKSLSASEGDSYAFLLAFVGLNDLWLLIRADRFPVTALPLVCGSAGLALTGPAVFGCRGTRIARAAGAPGR